MTLFYIIIAILVADYVLNQTLDHLNSTWRSKPIPQELTGIYDDEKYKKQQSYSQTVSKFSLIESTVMLVATLAFFFLDGFKFVDGITCSATDNMLLQGLLFIAILLVATEIISTPFDIYDTFVIEQEYGFNTTTRKIYITDKLKDYLVTAIIGGGLYSLIYWFYSAVGQSFWIYAWIAVSAFSLFMSMFYSTLIVPLFNKQTPLPEGELRDALNQFSQKVGFNLDGIFVIDNSKRSTRANAYFTGFGKKKRIVLFDTLIKQMTTEEIVAVLAHEVGHYKKHHIVWTFLFSIIQTGIILFLFSLLVSSPHLSTALGISQPKFHISMIAFGLLYNPISVATQLLANVFSRRNEYQADEFSAQNSNAQDLVSALKKLASNNLSNLTPHPTYVWFKYSHPSLLQRVRALTINTYCEQKKHKIEVDE